MKDKESSAELMAHDPLADIEDLSTAADDFLGLGDDFTLEDELQGLEQIEQEVAAIPAKPAAAAEPEPEPEPEPESAATQAAEVIDLGDVLTIREVGQMHERLLQALIDQGGEDYRLSAAELQQVDGAAVQMLVAFVQEATRRGCGLHWQASSEALNKAAADMGLDQALRLT
ncbi:MAG: STAS domain-containing protein [Gammaproteobacteria bacterium SHHR-1]|uniref:STAS domain-containing protein n=1 Tax=Magnetovirga frankeli TaxID=947516 RepID=UPI001293FB04|nr:STAS domain-containing protein [gamma proteobacterium SS-5]